LILFVLGATVLLGFTAMAIDIGMFFEDRRHLQNTSDAAALAGVVELPQDPPLAKSKARDWALKHGITDAQIESIEVTSVNASNDTITVEVDKEFGWIFARVFGKTTTAVGARAAARVGSLAGGHDMMPWALLIGDPDCLDANGDPKFGATCQVKVGGGSGITGWYGALDFDGVGGGSAEYDSNIIDGTVDSTYCIFGDPAPYCASAETSIDALSGNKVGGTASGIIDRLAVGAQCDGGGGNGVDDFAEVFTLNPGGDPTYNVACPDSPWLIIVPIVSYSSVPVGDVTIRGWTLAYLNSYTCVGATTKNCATGHWEVQIKIVDAAYSQVGGFLGAYDPNSGILLRRLVE